MIRDRKIVHEVTYPYPLERVWQALVDPKQLAVWLMPNDFLPVLGRRFAMSCDPIGELEAEVLELDPPHRLSCRWTGLFGDTVVTFDLTPVEGGTHLRLEHRGWNDANSDAGNTFDSGWTEKLNEGLTRVLAGSVS